MDRTTRPIWPQKRGLSSFDSAAQSGARGRDSESVARPYLSGFELAPIFRYNSSHPFNLLAGTNVNNDRHSTTDRPPGVGRNTGVGPNYVSFDTRLSWQFKMGEKSTLQFMVEGFNLSLFRN